MHIPGTKKSAKRKASVVSVGDSEKKEGKKKARSTQRRVDEKAASPTPDAQPQTSPPRSPTTCPDERVDSVTESPPSTALAHAHTDPAPRRSSRIKNSLHSVAQTWDKARPYIERINGTIMPLEPQAGVEVYYNKDGVK